MINVYKATEEELVSYIEEHNDFTESDIWDLFDMDYAIETSYGENRRWSRSAYTIFAIGGRYFAIAWEQGLTECQEDYVPYPYLEEVEPFEEIKVVKGWRIKTDDK